MRKAIFGLGFFLIAACGGSSEKEDSEPGTTAASGGDAESGGGSVQDRGGSTSTGGDAGSSATGTGGSPTGGLSSGGSSTGGSPRGGSNQGGAMPGGSTSRGGGGGAAAAQGGAAAGMAGSAATAAVSAAGGGGRAGAGGTGGTSIVAPECDPDTGELDNTRYPDCQPRDPSDVCELCVEASCCEAAKVCYGYDPMNVCGWGGPRSGTYGGMNEIDCFIACARDYVEENGAYDAAADDRCVPACTTQACGLIGNATQDLVVCLQANCEDDCFWPP